MVSDGNLFVDLVTDLGALSFHQVMQQAGIEDQQVVLLLEDHQFLEPQFLELINSLLSAGEVPGLYTPEELDPILTPLKNQASEAGFRGTILQYFASRELIDMLVLGIHW